MSDLGNMTVTVSGDVNPLKKSMDQAAAVMQSAGKKIQTGANQAGQALTNLGRVAQDAPYGFIGIQNNLNPLLESFQRLRAETGSNAKALRSLASSLVGPAGIGLALSSLGLLMPLLIEGFDKLSGASSKFSQQQKAMVDISMNAVKGYAEEATHLRLLSAEYNAAGTSQKRRKEIQDELVKSYPNYFSHLKTEKDWHDGITDAINKTTKALFIQAKIQAATQLLSEKFKKSLEAKFKPEEQIGFWDKTKSAFDALRGNYASGAKTLVNSAIEGTKKAEKEYEEFAGFITASVIEWNMELDKLGGDPKTGDVKKSTKIPKKKKELEDLLKIQKQIKNSGIESITTAPKGNTTGRPESPVDFDINAEALKMKLLLGQWVLLQDAIKQTENILNTTLGPAFDAMFDAIGNGGKDAFSEFGKALAQTLKQLAFAVVKGLIFGAIISAITGSPFKIGDIIGKATGLKGFATGGQNIRGGTYMVGERGPELMRVPGGSDIIPNRGLRMGNLGGGGSQTLIPDVQLRGADLWLSFQRESARRGRNG